MNTPPDGPGRERPPSPPPSPTRMSSSRVRTPLPRIGAPRTEALGEARKKRLRRKAAYRARRSTDDAFREAERQRAREWRRNNPDKTRAQKTKSARSQLSIARSLRSTARARIIRAEILSIPACAIQGMTPILGGARHPRRPPARLADGGRDMRTRQEAAKLG